MAEKSARSRIPFSFTFGARSPSRIAQEAGDYTSAHGPDDGVPSVQHIEYADLRESISTAPTSHHPSIASEVSRFSFSTVASSPEDELPKSQHVEDAADETSGSLLYDQSDDCLAISEGGSCRANDDVSEFYLAERVRTESIRSGNSKAAEPSSSSSHAPATNNGVPAFYRTQPAHQSLLRYRTQSEPLSRLITDDTFPNSLPHSLPPPSYASVIEELHSTALPGGASPPASISDGYFRAYKSTAPEECRPRLFWASSQRIVAPLKQLKLPKFSKLPSLPLSYRDRKSVPVISRPPSSQSTQSQALESLHKVRALLIPYHQSIASYHAQCIERYVEQAEANIWESQDDCAFRTPSVCKQSIWGPQDASDPIPRWTFWDKAVSSPSLMSLL